MNKVVQVVHVIVHDVVGIKAHLPAPDRTVSGRVHPGLDSADEVLHAAGVAQNLGSQIVQGDLPGEHTADVAGRGDFRHHIGVRLDIVRELARRRVEHRFRRVVLRRPQHVDLAPGLVEHPAVIQQFLRVLVAQRRPAHPCGERHHPFQTGVVPGAHRRFDPAQPRVTDRVRHVRVEVGDDVTQGAALPEVVKERPAALLHRVLDCSPGCGPPQVVVRDVHAGAAVADAPTVRDPARLDSDRYLRDVVGVERRQ